MYRYRKCLDGVKAKERKVAKENVTILFAITSWGVKDRQGKRTPEHSIASVSCNIPLFQGRHNFISE
jgi:hypothetical protein